MERGIKVLAPSSDGRANASYWSAYPGSETCRVCGCCCCTAHQHVPFTAPKRHVGIFGRRMKVCGGASVPFCKWIQHSQTEKLPQCHCLWGSGSPQCILGQLGCLGVIRQRHPDVVAQSVRQVGRVSHTPSLEAAASASEESRDLIFHRGKLLRMVLGATSCHPLRSQPLAWRRSG